MVPSDAGHTNTDSVLEQAVGWLRAGRRVALATVTRTWGSAPRRAGSHMAVAEGGDFTGSVSGGCVESAVVHAAAEVIESGDPQRLRFGVTDEMAWEVGLACGGEVEVYVRRSANSALLDALLEAGRSGRSVVLATRLGDGVQELVSIGPAGAYAPRDIAGVSADQVYAALRAEEAQVAETPRGTVLLRPYTAPRRLVTVGAVHIAQVLARTSPEIGMATTVVDPREGFATRKRFPGAQIVRAWPDAALERIGLDARSAVVVLAHDPKIDDPALVAALRSDAFYIGALGGRRTRRQRRRRLGEAGVAEDAMARVHSPVGLPIGARTPAEIALAILGQIVDVVRNPEAPPLARQI